MKIKKNQGFVAIDMTIAIMALLIFTGLIISLMYNNFLENVKIKANALATIYLTETFENIAISDYDDITQENIQNFIPENLSQTNFNMDITITEADLSDNEDEDIIKKINAVISCKIGNRQYSYSMERTKLKE